MKNLRLCLILVLPVLFAQTPPPAAPAEQAAAPGAAPAAPAGPTEEEQAKLIAAIREAALAWEGKLGDFTCNRTGRLEARIVQDAKAPAPAPKAPPAKPADPKAPPAAASAKAVPQPATNAPPKTAAAGRGSSSPPGTGFLVGPWETLQLNEDRATYAGHKESYSGNAPAAAAADADRAASPGKKTPAPPPVLEPAPISAFADLLKGIFTENSHTEFTWKGMVGMRGLPVYVFEYKVAKENSTQELVAGPSHLIVAYHGTIYADRLTRRVMSVSFDADTPADFPEHDVSRVFDFGQVIIAGQFNLLPLKCQMQMRCSLDLLHDGKVGGKSPQLMARLTTDFLSYHKYFPPAAPAPAR